MKEGRDNTEPREALLEDLKRTIEEDHNKGKIVILTGDMNGDLANGKRITKFLKDVEMYNVMEARHGSEYPITFDRGKHCPDLIVVSNTMSTKWIQKCEYLPFYKGIMADHRGMYADFVVKEVFDYVKEDTNKEIYRRFKTTQVPKCKKYTETLETYLSEAKISEKIDDLEQEMYKTYEEGKEIGPDLIQCCKILFEKTTQLMFASEKKAGRAHYKNGFPASRALKKATDEYFEAKANLQRATNYRYGKMDNEKVKEQKQLVKQKKHELKYKQKRAAKLREDDLLLLAEKRAEEWNIKSSKVILVIRESERSRNTHRKQQAFMKPQQKGGIRKVLVPAPKTNVISKEKNITDHTTQYEVEDQNHIFDILLRQNFNHLMKSRNSIFMQGELVLLCRGKKGKRRKKRKSRKIHTKDIQQKKK